MMKTQLTKYALCAGLLALSGSGSAAERLLPPQALVDDGGRAANLAALAGSEPWTLLVVDPARPQTRVALERLLPHTGGSTAGNLVVVAVGADGPFQELVRGLADGAAVPVYRDTEGTLLKTMRLPGLPAVLGIEGGNRIVWQTIGVPRLPAKARSLVESWPAGGGAR